MAGCPLNTNGRPTFSSTSASPFCNCLPRSAMLLNTFGSDTISKTFSGDLGQDRALEPDPPFRFVNHSCQPNCGLGGFIAWDEQTSRSDYVMYLEALVAIAPGEQLTIDYAWPAGSA